jgi:hypothetical protein
MGIHASHDDSLFIMQKRLLCYNIAIPCQDLQEACFRLNVIHLYHSGFVSLMIRDRELMREERRV